jgi:predicted lipoprotein with Yx(FWY)xxD motif
VKPNHILLAGVLAGVAATSSATSAPASTAKAKVAGAPTVQLRNTSLGKILVDASGFTLYEFTRDARNTNSCVKVSKCSKVWPSLTVKGRPTAGAGVKSSLLSTITLPGGSKQVTYAGHPLYTYSESIERGETSYVGVKHFGGAWDALTAAGATIK